MPREFSRKLARPSRYKKKYKTADQIESMAELLEWIDAGGFVFMWGTQPKHPAFVISQQLRTLQNAVKAKKIYKAIRIDASPSEAL